MRRLLLLFPIVLVLAIVGAALASREEPRPLRVGVAHDYDEDPGGATLASACGKERWTVKTVSDADKARVSPTAYTTTTIENLRSKVRPSTLPSNNRVAPVETTDWRITGYLKQYRAEADSDIHLVIEDANNRTMIVEIPSPSCVSASTPSAIRNEIAATRRTFYVNYSPTTSWKYTHRRITIRGPGFFDFRHNQTGIAPNAIEVHPVLGIGFP